VKRVSLEEFAQILDELPGELRDASVRGLQSAGSRYVGKVVEAIDTAEPHPAVDTGSLRQSVDKEDLGDGAVVAVNAPHAQAIENGARPHFPPIEPLVRWVMRKGFAMDEEEARGIAFRVAKKMAEVGIAPRHYMAKSWREVPQLVKDEIDAELAALADRIG